MSLLAAIAKGFGAGTLDNAKVGFAEQQRQREAAQRKQEQSAEWAQRDKEQNMEWDRRDAQFDKQLQADQERIRRQEAQNQLDREQRYALAERQYTEATRAALASSSAKLRENNAKTILGHLDALSKQRYELLANDKISDEQRAIALGEIDYFGNMLVSDPGAQVLLNEVGGGARIAYWQNLAPQQKQNPQNEPQQQQSATPQAPLTPPSNPLKETSLLGRLQRKSGEAMASGYDPKYRQPLDVTKGQPIKLSSEFSLPNDDSHVPAYARYNK